MTAWRFDGYWKDVGTLVSLWDANMDMLSPGSGLNLLDRRWPIYSRTPSCPPAYVGAKADIGNSVVAKGCEVLGEVKNSVLSYNTQVGGGGRRLLLRADARRRGGVGSRGAVRHRG